METSRKMQGLERAPIVFIIAAVLAAEAQSIALALGATVSGLPSGEAKPDADILIIAGR